MERTARHGPAYLRMLATIVVAYALIIGLGETAGGIGRMVVLGYLLWDSLHLRGARWMNRGRWVRGAIVAATALAVGATIGVTIVGSEQAQSAVVGALTFIATLMVIVTIAKTVAGFQGVDTPTVLGVLAIYLLLALLFASINQFFSAFQPGYLKGVEGLPTGSDLLYFSVITIATVGFGDITPLTDLARAVTVVEALVGQLYLVSVVAGVVGGWRRPDRA